jgi:uncharacterized membrane protein YccC
MTPNELLLIGILLFIAALILRRMSRITLAIILLVALCVLFPNDRIVRALMSAAMNHLGIILIFGIVWLALRRILFAGRRHVR